MIELTKNAINKAAQEYTDGAKTNKRRNFIEWVKEYLIENKIVPPFQNKNTFEKAIQKECMDFLNNYIRLGSEDYFYND